MNFITEEVYKEFCEIASADSPEDVIADATEDKLESYHAINEHVYIMIPYLRRFRGSSRATDILIAKFKIQNIANELAFLAIFCGNAHYTRVALEYLDKLCPANVRTGWSQKVFSEIFAFAGRKSGRKISKYVNVRLSDSDYYAVSPVLPERIRKYLRLFTESLYVDISGDNSAYIAEIAQTMQKKTMLFAVDANCDRSLSLDIIKVLNTLSPAKPSALFENDILTVYFRESAFWTNEFGKKLFRDKCASDPKYIYGFSFDKDVSKIVETLPDIFGCDAITSGLREHPGSSLFVWMLRVKRGWFTSKSGDILPEFYPNIAEKLYICSSELSPGDIAGVFEYMLSRAENDPGFTEKLRKNIVENIHILTKDRIVDWKARCISEDQHYRRLRVIARKLVAICDEEFSAVYCKEFRKKYDKFVMLYGVPAEHIRFV